MTVTRVTKRYPGRVVFLGVNLAIALILAEANMFGLLRAAADEEAEGLAGEVNHLVEVLDIADAGMPASADEPA